MKVPVSWLKDYTDIKLPLKDLMWKMTEIGITTESFEKIGEETVLDCEVTPNRPDWLSIIGIAREVAVINNARLKLPNLPNISKKSSDLPLNPVSDFSLCPRYVGVTVADVKVKPSPAWLQEKLKLVGLRPINNLVDITNFAMFETGIPVHVFDYDSFENKTLVMQKTRGGEEFTSVDGISYKLPKGAIIINDGKRVIDLCGIKGGQNSGITSQTKNIFIHVPVYTPYLIRTASQNLSLASEASYIYERGADAGSSMNTLKRVVDMTLISAGGKIASEVFDFKNKSYAPRKVEAKIENIEKILGLSISEKQILGIFESLALSPKKIKDKITCQIPSFRDDIQIEEDLAEEIARIYGYNKFPKTLPIGQILKTKAPYTYDITFHMSLKNLMTGAGFSEVMTFSLLSAETINKAHMDVKSHIKLANPVSSEYEYLQMSGIPSLLIAAKQNSEENLQLFEVAKVYLGTAAKPNERYKLTALLRGDSFKGLKGVVDLILGRLGIEDVDIKPTVVRNGLWHPVRSGVLEKGKDMIGTFGEIHPKVLQKFDLNETNYTLELDVETLKKLSYKPTYKPVPKYPAQVEDVTLEIPDGVGVGNVISEIKKSSKLIADVELRDVHKKNYTFRICYQDKRKTLTDKVVESIRNKMLKSLKKTYGDISEI